ncbi:hypothetical protein PACTADRAFT_47795 [Pachysolen tannophilus NRRL Y-2460]|uniref:Structure-specific endonuclease subunit SLX4 n=1 Tax=Pachysolen tannophilus NRRL Y-2460 TaxID=669874 RepID=A0A1E4U1V2_PACTA|nr:hypothetical protein PACTADRAFT_47795 [Pachysolen tannophilus NRRL Y-2460]
MGEEEECGIGDKNELYISTQFQSKLDEWEAEDDVKLKLQKFKNDDDYQEKNSVPINSNSMRRGVYGRLELGGTVVMDSRQRKEEEEEKKKKKKKKKNSEKQRKRPKIKSITSHVTSNYSNFFNKSPETAKRQISILKLLSGRKRKVNDIIRRIQAIEGDSGDSGAEGRDRKSAVDDDDDDEEEYDDYEDQDLDNSVVLYKENEWFDIIKSINLKFPNLSKASKLTLSKITTSLTNNEEKLNLASSDGIWNIAANPPVKLTKDELTWLYDLDDYKNSDDFSNGKVCFNSSQLSNDDSEQLPFLMTLSQVLSGTDYGNKITKPDWEISDSSPELSPLPMDNTIVTEDKQLSRTEPQVKNNTIPNSNKSSSSIIADFSNVDGNDNKNRDTDDEIEEISKYKFKLSQRNKSQLETIGSSKKDPITLDTSLVVTNNEEKLRQQNNDRMEDPCSSMPDRISSKIQVPKSFVEPASSDMNLIESTSAKSPTNSSLNNHEIVTSSPVFSQLKFKKKNELENPNRFINQVEPENTNIVVLSSQESDYGHSINQLPGSFNENENENEEVAEIDEPATGSHVLTHKNSQEDTVYSTANSDFFDSIKLQEESSNLNENRKRKKVTETTRVEFKGKLKSLIKEPQENVTVMFKNRKRKSSHRSETNNSNNDNEQTKFSTTTKLIEVKKRKYDLDEIANSSEDEEGEDISVIEITKVFEETNHNDNSDDDNIIQVPSSQKSEIVFLSIADKDPHENVQSKNDSGKSKDEIYSTNNTAIESSNNYTNQDNVNQQLNNTDDEEEEEEYEENFESLSTQDLRTKLNSWGLKTSKSRAKMLETLKETSKLIDQSQLSQFQQNNNKNTESSQLPSLPLSQQENSQLSVKGQIFDKITDLVMKNESLHLDILMFKPISLKYFQKLLADANINIDISLVKKYLDEQGIVATENESVNKEGVEIDNDNDIPDDNSD